MLKAIRMLAGKGATLLVTVDCGTTSFEPLAEARRLGHVGRRYRSTINVATNCLKLMLW